MAPQQPGLPRFEDLMREQAAVNPTTADMLLPPLIPFTQKLSDISLLGRNVLLQHSSRDANLQRPDSFFSGF